MAHPPTHLGDSRGVKKAFERIRKICMGLERVYEKESWGEPTFRVEKGKMFLMFADDHHGDGRVGFWCMSTADAREALLQIDGERFYIPPYVGPSGWVGVEIRGAAPWDIIEEVIREGHRLGQPKPKATPKAKAKATPAPKTKRTAKA
jgi:hypothetical protein